MSVQGTWNIGGWRPRDFGITEWARKLLGKLPSAEVTTRFNNPLVVQAAERKEATSPGLDTLLGPSPNDWSNPANTSRGVSTDPNAGKHITTTTNNNTGGGNGGNNGGGTRGGSRGGNITRQQALDKGWDTNNLPAGYRLIEEASNSQQDAARAAAEAKRQAAERAYQAKVKAAGLAKGQAKGQYDWLIKTLGSHKEDLLKQVSLNETQGIQNYETQQKQTQRKYDKAKQEILQTYRDLQREQERIMRGTGQGQSSRAQEATLKLNNLLGKDMSNITTNEADSLALIGNALTAFKTNTLNTKNSIEKDTSSRIDKATLDYNQQIQKIDMNTTLSANEKADAYAAAEAQLASDTAKIKTWAAGQKLAYQQAVAKQKGIMDDYISTMTDANGLLNSDLGTKTDATNKVLVQAGFTPMEKETGLQKVEPGVYQSDKRTYKTKEELDASGLKQSNPMEYQRQLAMIQSGQTSPMAIIQPATPTGTNLPTSVQKDPLLRAMFA